MSCTAAAFVVLGIPPGGEAKEDFWFDELFVSSQGSPEALGKLTGRVHLAFQAPDRTTVDRFHRAGRSPPAAATTARQASGRIIMRTITAPSFSIQTATISKRCAIGRSDPDHD